MLSGRRSRSLGENALRTQLTVAQQRIASLEGYINSREREYQVTVSRIHGDRRDSYDNRRSSGQFTSTRRRRMGIRTPHVLGGGSIDEEEHDGGITDNDNDVLSDPLGEFVSLKINKIIPKDETTPTPFVVKRFCGRVYHIGPNGITIGTSPRCDIILPAEAFVEKEHCQIAWNKDGGHFVLRSLMGVVKNSPDSTPLINELQPLFFGVRFITGLIEWELTALPNSVATLAKLFYFARQKNLTCLREELEKIEPSVVPTVTVTGTDSSDDTPLTTPTLMTSYDINQEYETPSYKGDEKFNNLFSSSLNKKSPQLTAHVEPDTPLSSVRHVPRLLLHVAIDNEDEEMVRYLLSRGADVNKRSGELNYTSLHYAALRNSQHIMKLLLEYGGDVEIRNIEHLTPLALTTSYSIRKFLLNSVLLCAAADAGDLDEVTRLLMTTPTISPNVLGLRHKNALHLASAKGFIEIVEILLLNGVNINLKGGTRSRTPLHYASSHGHSNIIQLLLSAGAHEYVRDSGGYTPLNICHGDACRLLHSKPVSLCIAVQSGDIEQVNRILSEEDPLVNNIINLRNENSHAPLHLASIIGSLELVQLLVSHGALVDIHGGSDSWTPLFYAAIAGHSDLVEFLLSVGANTEEQDTAGNTVRARVSKVIEETEEFMTRLKKRNRSDSVVETTLIPRLSVNMLRQDSAPSCSVENQLEWQNIKLLKLKKVLSLLTTPAEKLMAAINDKNLTEFVSLLESGIVSPDVCIEDTSVLVRVCEDELYGFTKALLDHGAKVCLNGPTDHIPLLVAAGNSNIPLMKLLIDYGADIHVQSTDTLSSVLHESALTNSLETVKYLLSVGASKELINIGGETPFDCTNNPDIRKLLASGNTRLLVAAMIGDIESINTLINEEKIPVNTEFYRNGYTALHQACESGHTHLIPLLISLGADVNIKGGLLSQTPLHISSQLNYIEISQILLKNGARVDIKDTNGQVPFEVASTNQMRKVLVECRVPSTAVPNTSEVEKGKGNKLCLICMDNVVNTIILPCGHQMFCTECVTQITVCALDRQPIREVIPIYK